MMKKMRKRFACTVAVLMAVVMMPSMAFAAPDEGGGWTEVADTRWYNVSDESFTINSAEELAGFAAIVNGTAKTSGGEDIATDNFEGKTITLGKDIDLTGGEWNPIGITEVLDTADVTYEDHPFSGTFDGAGHTIKGLTITSVNSDVSAYRGMNTGYEAYGLFGGLCGGTVKNLVISDVNINTPGTDTNNNTVAAAVGAAINGSTIENVKVESGTVTGHSRAAGIVGFVGDPNGNAPEALIENNVITIKGCVNEATVETQNLAASYGTAGGICATANTYDAQGSRVIFEGNANTGDVEGVLAAGILASTFMYYDSVLVLEGNTNSGNIAGLANDGETASASGIAETPSNNNGSAHPEAGPVKVTVNNNINTGAIMAESGYASGLIHSARFVIFGDEGNTNSGNITGIRAGGISAYTDSGNFVNLTNTGNVTSNGNSSSPNNLEPFAGGIVGRTGVGSLIDGATCINTGIVTMNSDAYESDRGNIVGEFVAGTIRNISDEDAIGSIAIVGNESYGTTLEKVFLNDLYFTGGHNQSFVYTIELKNTSIGKAILGGKVHTGINIEVTGNGTIDEFITDGLVDNNGANTTLSFAATGNAQVGTLDATDEATRLGLVKVAANDGGHIDIVNANSNVNVGYVLTQDDEIRVFANSENAISTVKTTAAISSSETVSDSSNSMSDEAILVTSQLDEAAKQILEAENTAGNAALFTGVELIASDGTTSKITLDNPLTIDSSRTLILNGVTLNVAETGTLTNSGEISKVNGGNLIIGGSESGNPVGEGIVTTPITSVTIGQEDMQLCPGMTAQLSATVEPNSATGGSVTWISRNSEAATVDGNGNITAQAEGATVIAAIVGASEGDTTGTVYDTIKITVGHDWSEEWYNQDSTHHWHQCERAGCTLSDNTQKDGYVEHTMEFIVDTPATETTEGSGHNECSVCGYKAEAQTIPATGTGDVPGDHEQDVNVPGGQNQDVNQNASDGEKGDASSATGDDSNIMLWISLMAIAAAAAAGTVIYGRRKRSN